MSNKEVITLKTKLFLVIIIILIISIIWLWICTYKINIKNSYNLVLISALRNDMVELENNVKDEYNERISIYEIDKLTASWWSLKLDDSSLQKNEELWAYVYDWLAKLYNWNWNEIIDNDLSFCFFASQTSEIYTYNNIMDFSINKEILAARVWFIVWPLISFRFVSNKNLDIQKSLDEVLLNFPKRVVCIKWWLNFKSK